MESDCELKARVSTEDNKLDWWVTKFLDFYSISRLHVCKGQN